MCFLYFKMVVAVFFLAIVASASSRVSFELETCGVSEYRCSDGRCISGSSYCDGRPDCDDGSDESHCELGFSFHENPLSRSKRQASTNNCKKNNFRCKDGTCISSYDKCDGVKNCPDGSDETFALCRNNKCQSNWFRCMYGACVDGTAPCNKVSECADNSDELLPRCRNEKQDIKGSFKCDDGQIIPMYSHCDGARDCADGSDETLRTCAGKTCPSYVFQCAYGACVDQGSDCDFKQDCADNSDESDELCNRNIIQTTSTTPPSTSGLCVLPPYPRHGKYAVTNLPFARPGQAYQTVVVRVTCDSGYRVMGNDTIFCINGQWQAEINDDTCAQFCKVPKTPSAKIRCKLTGDASGSRVCQEYEPPDTELDFKCEQNYIQDSSKDGVVIVCLGGTWSDSIPCIAGVPKNGTNITILIKDKVEIFISDFIYYNGNTYNTNTPIESTPVTKTTVQPITVSSDTTVAPVTEFDYDIDPMDWRMGTPRKTAQNSTFKINKKKNVLKQILTPNRNITLEASDDNKKPVINLNISNSSVIFHELDNTISVK